MTTCEEYFLIVDTANHLMSSPDVNELRDHVDECDDCDVDIPDEDDAVLNYYLETYNDPEFEDFADRYRGLFDSFEDFVEETLSEIYGEEYEDLIDKCNKMGLHTPEIDTIAWGQDYDYHGTTGAVFLVV